MHNVVPVLGHTEGKNHLASCGLYKRKILIYNELMMMIHFLCFLSFLLYLPSYYYLIRLVDFIFWSPRVLAISKKRSIFLHLSLLNPAKQWRRNFLGLFLYLYLVFLITFLFFLLVNCSFMSYKDKTF